MGEHPQRLAFNLRIAVSHRDRRFLMTTGEEFRFLISPVIDHRLVQGPETGSRIRADVFDVERLDDVDHKVGAAPVRCQNVDFRRRSCFCARRRERNGRGPLRLSRLALGHSRWRSQCRRAGNGCSFQKPSTIR